MAGHSTVSVYLQGWRAARLRMLSLLRLLRGLPAEHARLRLGLAVERCSQRGEAVHAEVLLAEQGFQHLKLGRVVQRHAQLLQRLLRDLVLLQGRLQGLLHAGHEGLLGRLGHASRHPLPLPREDIWLGRGQRAKEPVQVLPRLQPLQITPCNFQALSHFCNQSRPAGRRA